MIIIFNHYIFGIFIWRIMRKLTTEEFIKRAKDVHGDKYDYSELLYITALKKVKIICKTHGIFEMTPSHHIRGQGCKFCSKNTVTSKLRNVSDFINKAIIVYNNEHDYSKVLYKNNKTSVIIICKKHGEFSTIPVNYLRGHGCPMCSRKNINGILNNDFYPAGYKTYNKKLSDVGVACHKNKIDERVLDVECNYCKKIFTPNRKNVYNKIYASKKLGGGEHNLYCGDDCKKKCPTFDHKTNSIDPRSILAINKSEQEGTRLCQTKTLKQLQCDTHGYNYCERCGDIIDVELHHTHEVAKYGSDAISSAGHILLCAGCHVEMHGECK